MCQRSGICLFAWQEASLAVNHMRHGDTEPGRHAGNTGWHTIWSIGIVKCAGLACARSSTVGPWKLGSCPCLTAFATFFLKCLRQRKQAELGRANRQQQSIARSCGEEQSWVCQAPACLQEQLFPEPRPGLACLIFRID